jgi:hypothetical protein
VSQFAAPTMWTQGRVSNYFLFAGKSSPMRHDGRQVGFFTVYECSKYSF